MKTVQPFHLRGYETCEPGQIRDPLSPGVGPHTLEGTCLRYCEAHPSLLVKTTKETYEIFYLLNIQTNKTRRRNLQPFETQKVSFMKPVKG